jgi:hypothetical protein
VPHRLNLFSIDSSRVYLEVNLTPNPLKAQDVFKPNQQYWFKLILTAKDCPSIKTSLIMSFANHTTIDRLNAGLPMILHTCGLLHDDENGNSN